MVKQEILDFIEMFSKRYRGSMFCEIGYRQVKGGKWTWEISGMRGNEYLDNKILGFYPIFENDIEASEAVILFCKKNWQFKNKQHLELYDFLPLL